MERIFLISLLIGLIFFSGCCGSTGNSTSSNGEPINAEIRYEITTAGMSSTITNRNTYNWTGLQVFADDYYNCKLSSNGQIIYPGKQAFVLYCQDNSGNIISSWSKMKIKTDQGEQQYTR